MSREAMLERLRAGETWDVLVIGGGATGLGTAVDASARGFRTLLVESHDFAKGTSSRSTKLIHGGVRYLAQGRMSLVREALHEREVLRRNAPHLVRDLPFVVPAYGVLDRPYYGLGLKLYDVLAGSFSLAPSRAVDRSEVVRRIPTIHPKGLRGGVVYHDGQFDDARLAISLMRTALDQGAVALNYMPVVELLKDAGRLIGARTRDAETGEEFSINARAIVNATGVFADSLRLLDDPAARPMLAPSQGVHVVLDRKFLPGGNALMIPKTKDGRVLFALPWHDRTIVGTTDVAVPAPTIEPRALPEEIEFLLEHARRYLDPAPTRSDVRSVFAGLRPLVAATHLQPTSRVSREHVLLTSPTGLITITGGKWTTYRRMAAQAVDRATEVGSLEKRDCRTADLRLHGWFKPPAPDLGTPYGADTASVEQIGDENPDWQAPLHPRLPYRGYEVVWGARHEGARTVEDILARRTRALLLDARACLECAPRVAEILADALGRDASWQAEQVRLFHQLASGYLLD